MKVIAIEEHWNSAQFFDAIHDPADRSKIASGNAEALFH